MKNLRNGSVGCDDKRFAVGVGTLIAWVVGGYSVSMMSADVSAKTIIQTPVAIEGSAGEVKIIPKLAQTGDKIVPYTKVTVLPEEKPLVKVDAGAPVIDRAEKKRIDEFQREYQNLFYIYQPRQNDQVILPVDIADIRLHTFKTDFWSRLALFGQEKKLSVYLDQHKKAKRFYSLYQQRVLAWHGGSVPTSGMTVEKAINEEALFPFLKIQLVSNETTGEMLKYLDGRLSAKDSDIVKRWVFANANESITADVATVIAQGIIEKKNNISLMTW